MRTMRIRGGVMRRNLALAAMALAITLSQGMFFPPRAATAAEQASEVIAGLVTRIDHGRSRVTVRSSDGRFHEFQASAETLEDLEVGDRIEATRRPATN